MSSAHEGHEAEGESKEDNPQLDGATEATQSFRLLRILGLLRPP